MMNKLMKKFFLAIVLVAFLPYTAFAKAPLTYIHTFLMALLLQLTEIVVKLD